MLKGTITRAAAALLLTAALAGTAFAGGGKPEDPGKSETAPGQVKQAQQPAQPAAQQAQPNKAQPSKGKSAAAKAKKDDKKAAQASKKATKSSQKAAKKTQRTTTTQQHGGGATPHKVIICHRTGSAKNPYVVINVDRHAWENGHQTHPPLDGRSDVLLKENAMPGEKLPVSMCPGGGTQPADERQEREQEHAKVLICHRTGSESNPYVIINIARAGWDNGHSNHEGDKLIRENVAPGEKPNAADLAFAEANCRPAPAGPAVVTGGNQEQQGGGQEQQQVAAAAAQQQQPPTGGGVAGARAALPAKAKPAAKAKPQGGVLGAVGRIGRAAERGELPFTGIPLWIAGLAGLGLLGAGLAVRRATSH